MDFKKAERVIKEILSDPDLVEQFSKNSSKAMDRLKALEKDDREALKELNSISHFSGFRVTLNDGSVFGQDTSNCGQGACGTDTTCKQGACVTDTSDCGAAACGTDTTCGQGACVTDTSDCGAAACATNISVGPDITMTTKAGPCVQPGIEASINVRFEFDVKFPPAPLKRLTTDKE